MMRKEINKIKQEVKEVAKELEKTEAGRVAIKAAKEINVLSEQIKGNHDVHVALLTDTLGDIKEDRQNARKDSRLVTMVLSIIIGLLLALTGGTGIYYIHTIKAITAENDARFKEFISQYDFTSYDNTSYDIEAKADNGSSITNSANIFTPTNKD